MRVSIEEGGCASVHQTSFTVNAMLMTCNNRQGTDYSTDRRRSVDLQREALPRSELLVPCIQPLGVHGEAARMGVSGGSCVGMRPGGRF